MVIFKCSVVILLLSFSQVQNGKIVVIGKAANAKAGAVVISNKDSLQYYVDGLSHWKENEVGKQVRVSGKLKVINTTPQKEDEPLKQMIVGTIRKILRPKFEFLE
jgi:hypothetical protein